MIRRRDTQRWRVTPSASTRSTSLRGKNEVDDIRKSQRELCRKFGAPFVEPQLRLKIGLSRNFDMHRYPINGLRHPPEGDTTGWYVWSGAWSDAPDFFQPHHLYHLYSRYPDLIKYLGLAAGWRFLFAPDHEDVWQDRSLLSI
jgi:hypothetical protein